MENGALHCIGNVPQPRVNLLTHVLSPEAGEFEVSVKISLATEGSVPGSAGLLVGLYDEEDPDIFDIQIFMKQETLVIKLLVFMNFLNFLVPVFITIFN